MSGKEMRVAPRVLEGRKVWGIMAKLWKKNMISREVKWELYQRIALQTMAYSSKTW